MLHVLLNAKNRWVRIHTYTHIHAHRAHTRTHIHTQHTRAHAYTHIHAHNTRIFSLSLSLSQRERLTHICMQMKLIACVFYVSPSQKHCGARSFFLLENGFLVSVIHLKTQEIPSFSCLICFDWHFMCTPPVVNVLHAMNGWQVAAGTIYLIPVCDPLGGWVMGFRE